MENTDNQNTTCHIAYTKLFKLSFQRASGNNSSAVKCDVEVWLLQDHEWIPCQLYYDTSMTTVLFRTDIDVWGDTPFFTSGIRTGIGKIVLKAPKTTVGKEVEDWLRDRKKIVIRLESRTVPDNPASILELLLSGIAQ